jgi:hypothetical protein
VSETDYGRQFTVSAIAVGLSLPALYAMLVSNAYLQIWLQILVTFTPGIGSLIFILGLVKASLLLAGSSKKVDNWSNGRVVQYGIAIHVGVGVIVLFSVLLSKLQASSNNMSPMEVTYAFIATEMLIFPVIGIVYLARSLQNSEGSYATIFLLSAVIYLDIILVIVSDILITNQSVLNFGRSALEIEGAKISFLLGAFASFATSPDFWNSHSFYSLDVLQIPNWVGGVYALTMAFYVYREERRSDLLSIKASVAHEGVKLTNPIMLACNLLLATVLGLAVVSVAHLILPLSIVGNSIQLLIGLACLASVAYFASR